MARSDRIAQAIRREVSLIIHDELRDPRLGFVTVMQVKVTDDLREARISFSVLGNDEERKKTAQALDSASGFVRKLIGERIPLRFVPEISFKEDRSSEYAAKIEEVLNQIKGLEVNQAGSFVAGQGEIKKPRKAGRSGPKKAGRGNKKK